MDALDAGMKNLSSNNENNQSFGVFGGSYLRTGNRYFEVDIPRPDIKVREAMTRAIDRQAIIETVYQDRATPVVVPVFAPFTESWSERWGAEFDDGYGNGPERAAGPLAEARYEPAEVHIESWSTVIPGNPEIPWQKGTGCPGLSSSQGSNRNETITRNGPR